MKIVKGSVTTIARFPDGRVVVQKKPIDWVYKTGPATPKN